MRLIYCPSPCPQGQTETAEGRFDFLQGRLSHAGGGGKLGFGEGGGGAERGDAEGFEAFAGAGTEEVGGGERGFAFGGVEAAGAAALGAAHAANQQRNAAGAAAVGAKAG